MKKYIQILLITIAFGCANKEVQDEENFINKSYKKQLASGDIDKNVVDYYEESTRLYSNFKYGIAFKETRDWEVDYGAGQYTIYRAYQTDSAITFSINVMETDLKVDFTAHDLVDEIGSENFKSQMISVMSKTFNDVVISQQEKTFFNNIPVIKTLLNHTVKHENETFKMTTVMYQFVRFNNVVTCSLTSPSIIMNENKESLEQVFDNIYFIRN